MKNKKGMFNPIEGIGSMVVPLVAIAIVLAIGFLIIAEAKTQGVATEGIVCNAVSGGHVCNSTKEIQGALDDIPGWLPIIVITVIGALLIGLVSMFRRQ